MAPARSGRAALVPLGFQVMSLTNSTAIAVNSTTRGSRHEARVLDISIETNSARFRLDGTAPTKTTGILLAAGYTRLEGYNGTSLLKFQRSTGTSKVSIQSYKYIGD